MIFVMLGRGHKYDSLDQIKAELQPAIVSLKPADCTNGDNIAILSTGQTIHLREIVYESERMLVEDVVREDVEKGPTVSRQMVFKSKPSMVQSEVQLIYRSATAKNADFQLAESVLKPPKKKKVIAFDRDTLTCEY